MKLMLDIVGYIQEGTNTKVFGSSRASSNVDITKTFTFPRSRKYPKNDYWIFR